jgi:ankyrin repeat protein
MLASRVPGIVNQEWTFRMLGVPLLAALTFATVSCDSRQELAQKNLAEMGVEASGLSLVRAVEAGDHKTAGLLLEAGVYTEQRDSHGRTPLGIAVRNRDYETAVMLLNARANLDATLADQSSILGIAAHEGDETMVKILLAGGARPSGLMPGGKGILPWAIREGRQGLVRTMMEADADPHLKDPLGNPLLHIAMEAGRRDLMESLIELGADPAATNAAGENTIQLAFRQGWVDTVPQLAAAGADPNARGADGRTLLAQAVAEDDAARVALLLKVGADPNLRSAQDDSMTPLQLVFANPEAGMFEVFLQNGAKPPGGDWGPWLWQAFESRDPEKTRLLLSHGARNHSRRTGGLSLVEAAVAAGEMSFVKLFLDYGLPVGRALYLASVRGDHDGVGMMLACGVSPEFTHWPSRETALSAAIRGRHDRVAELLVKYGACTDLTPVEGQSVFLLAIATGCHRTVKQLLDAGADPNVSFESPVSEAFVRQVRKGVMRWVLKKDTNATPLMLAADSGNIQSARHLIKAGAKMNVRTRDSGLWPINFASRRGDVRMMRLFLGRDPFHEDRRIEISLSEQRARIFDSEGNEVWITKVSTGRKGFATPVGEYVITNKYRNWTSTLYDASMPYFQRLSCGDFGLHQGNVPGYPASHGCIRVPSGNAEKLYSMTQTGDRVRILP